MPIHYAPDQIRDRYAEALRLCSQECELRLGEGYDCLMHFHGYNIPLTLGLRQAAASPCRRHARRAPPSHIPRAGPQLAPEPPIPSIRTNGTGAASIGFLGAIFAPLRAITLHHAIVIKFSLTDRPRMGRVRSPAGVPGNIGG